MQTFEDQQRYQLDPDALLAKFTDPVFLQGKYETLGRQDIRLLENTRSATRGHLVEEGKSGGLQFYINQ